MTDTSLQNETRDQIKERIILSFNQHVRGRTSNTSGSNVNHDGRDGHWLETQMGVAHNGNNDPDIDGFEMKNHTKSKTTFGDWSPDFSLFKRGMAVISRDIFLSIFGAPNPLKNNRYSWSGRPCPKINVFNSFGQKLEVDENDNILAIYSYTHDQRPNKSTIVPTNYQQDYLIIASWSAELMRRRIGKFNKLGWFKCNKDMNGVYTSIVFGEPINFDSFIQGVKNGSIFFDSGMYAGNNRPYSQWRANNSYWDALVTETN